MRIVDHKSVSGSSPVRNGARGGGSGGVRFSIEDGTLTARLESHAPISILGGLEALIAIKAEDTTRERRRRSVKRGQSMLDVLDELKLALLAGRLPPDMPARISATLREAMPSGDPALDTILDAIELRAEVELAKLKQARRQER